MIKDNSFQSVEEQISRLEDKIVEIVIDGTKKGIVKWKPLKEFVAEDSYVRRSLRNALRHISREPILFVESKSYFSISGRYLYFCLFFRDIENLNNSYALLVIPDEKNSPMFFKNNSKLVERLYNILRFTISSADEDKEKRLSDLTTFYRQIKGEETPE